ncbi:MAG: cob(I)yrinic acid a,c-diamide adenosyltransferase [Phycisphaerae bacterium]|nr:cob(I)yrinic acid a,c-diamide adenosyltransferase [Phycisphaerae bacterium]
MTLYTKNGDAGKTCRMDGETVSKASPQIEAIGTIDELSSHLGLCASGAGKDNLPSLAEVLVKIQNELFNVGSQLAAVGTPLFGAFGDLINVASIERLEKQIDDGMQTVGELQTFILPGGTELAARFHVARTVARRTERTVVTLIDSGVDVPPIILQYLNRLGDLLFVFARLANKQGGFADVMWTK